MKGGKNLNQNIIHNGTNLVQEMQSLQMEVNAINMLRGNNMSSIDKCTKCGIKFTNGDCRYLKCPKCRLTDIDYRTIGNLVAFPSLELKAPIKSLRDKREKVKIVREGYVSLDSWNDIGIALIEDKNHNHEDIFDLIHDNFDNYWYDGTINRTKKKLKITIEEMD